MFSLNKSYTRCVRTFNDWLKSCGVAGNRNEKKLAKLKNKHRGQRCFVIGSGPSLKIDDLDNLKGEVTFACNKIYLAFDSTDWRPTYYSVIDVLVAENNKTEIEVLNLKKIYTCGIKKYLDEGSALWVNELDVPKVNGEYTCNFSDDIIKGAYGGWTVIYLQLQLAYYMGIREVYLLGIDFSFNVPAKTGVTCPSGEVLFCGGEVNHFHKDYRKQGESWTVPLLDLQRKAFTEARRFYEKNGGRIINASRMTELDVFERKRLEDVL